MPMGYNMPYFNGGIGPYGAQAMYPQPPLRKVI